MNNSILMIDVDCGDQEAVSLLYWIFEIPKRYHFDEVKNELLVHSMNITW